MKDSDKLIGLFVVVIVDGIHLVQQGFFVQAAAGAQGVKGIVVVPELGVYVTKQNHRIFWYHKIGSPLRFIAVHTRNSNSLLMVFHGRTGSSNDFLTTL